MYTEENVNTILWDDVMSVAGMKQWGCFKYVRYDGFSQQTKNAPLYA